MPSEFSLVVIFVNGYLFHLLKKLELSAINMCFLILSLIESLNLFAHYCIHFLSGMNVYNDPFPNRKPRDYKDVQITNKNAATYKQHTC